MPPIFGVGENTASSVVRDRQIAKHFDVDENTP